MDAPEERTRHGKCSDICEGSDQRRMIRRTWSRTRRRPTSFWRSRVGHFSSSNRRAGFFTSTGPERRIVESVVCLVFLVATVHGLHPSTPNLFSSRRLGRVPPSTTQRRMVLRTPESIIEQASTTTLLDDLIDESVRTSARRPIMMQFDPSSGWIWKRWKGTIFSETWDDCVSFSHSCAGCCALFGAMPRPHFTHRSSSAANMTSLSFRLRKWCMLALFSSFADRSHKSSPHCPVSIFFGPSCCP
jgi:hypothetical protein